MLVSAMFSEERLCLCGGVLTSAQTSYAYVYACVASQDRAKHLILNRLLKGVVVFLFVSKSKTV